jgi:hypothetical protein
MRYRLLPTQTQPIRATFCGACSLAMTEGRTRPQGLYSATLIWRSCSLNARRASCSLDFTVPSAM